MQEQARSPHLKHVQIIRLGRFLDMLYRPAEVAEEIGVTPDTIYRSYMPAGMPCIRDDKGNIWIHGPAFVGWAKQTVTRRAAERVGLDAGQAWCLRCNHPVKLVNPTVKVLNRYLALEQAKCPECGTTVNRGRGRA